MLGGTQGGERMGSGCQARWPQAKTERTQNVYPANPPGEYENSQGEEGRDPLCVIPEG